MLFVTAALVAIGPTVPAQADDWTGAVSNDWFDPANWLDGSVPTSADDVRLETITPNPAVIGGGSAFSRISTIGQQAGSQGSVTITGGGIWDIDYRDSPIRIGDGGTGSLAITGGGTLVTRTYASIIGDQAGAQGTVTVSGAGSNWTHTLLSELQVGNYGSGELLIDAGGTVITSHGSIGNQAGSLGTVTVSGTGSSWAMFNSLNVGNAGTGVLHIDAGGTVTSDDAIVGNGAGSQGTVTVSGAGSLWDIGSHLSVGNFGDGSLTVEDGGAVINSYGSIGYSGTGTATVTGVGSTWTNSEDLTVDGTLNIEDGGEVSNANGTIGSAAGSTGTVAVSGVGSTWANSGELIVGNYGNGTLTVADGGTVNSGNADIGFNASGVGGVTLSGADSSWTSNGIVNVGTSGTGTLLIKDGATLRSSESLFSTVGLNAGSSGTLTVTGEGSSWVLANSLDIGRSGTGTMIIADGGLVSDTIAAVGNLPGSDGEAIVTGAGSTWNNSLNLYIGNFSTGAMMIADGGTVTSASGPIGNGAGVGTVTVTGADSQWLNTGEVRIGGAGTGTLTIGDGGTVSTTQTTIATEADGVGTLNIGAAASDAATAAGTLDTASVTFGEGAGAINFNHTDTDYEFAPAISGNGAVNQLAGATILTGASSYTGATNVDGGTLLVEGSLGDTATSVADGATLGGSGSISGDVTIADGGTIAPGSSAGTLTVGSLALSGGSNLDYELGQSGVIGGGANDLIEVTGDLTLDGTLDIMDIGGFGVGVYRLMNYGGALTDNALVFGALPTGITAADLWVQTSVPNQVNLINTAGAVLQFWDGDAVANANNGVIEGGNGVWTAASHTWTKADGAVNGAMKPKPGFAIFQAAPGIVTADKSAGALAVTGMQFATDGYRIEGDPITLAGTGGKSIIRVGGGSAAGAAITATIASELTGAGSLVKTDLGTLILSGANSYQGNTLVAAGTLTGTVDSIRGGVGNAGTVVFDQGTDANFTGNVAGLDGVDGAMVKQGAGMLTLTGGSTLDWTVRTGGLTTAAERFIGDVAIGADGTFTFDQTVNTQYAGTLEGAGSFIKAGTGTLLYDGDGSSFTGNTTITDGSLIVGSDADNADAALGGSVDVQDGGTLGGHGTIGSGAGSMVMIAAGGTIAPGHSPGTLTVDGGITFDAGSTYLADINPALESDLIDASGAATIDGGTVHAVKAGGVYTPGSRWTIVGADGGVTGTFDGLTQNMPFVDLALAYDANNVYIDATRNDVAFCTVAGTFNQCSTGDGLETTGAGNPVYDAVAALPDEDSARQALDALSGEIHASAKSALIEDSRFPREAATARVRAAFNGVAAPALPVMAYGEGGARPVSSDTDRFAVWAHGFGSWGTWDSDGNAAEFERSIGGMFIGADAPVGNWRLGLIAGYSHSSFNVDDRASSGETDNYHLGIYGGTEWGQLGFRTGAAYTWHDIDTSRSIAFPGFAGSADASYDAATAQVFGELGYRIDTAVASFEPFAGLAYVNLDTDGFTEDGGAAALTVDGGSTDTTFTTLGVRASTGFTLGGMNATARGMLGWRHAFGDTTPLSTHAFAGGDAFTIAGVPIAEDAAVIEAGLDLAITDNATLGVSYSGQIASDAHQHGFKANLAVRF